MYKLKINTRATPSLESLFNKVTGVIPATLVKETPTQPLLSLFINLY